MFERLQARNAGMFLKFCPIHQGALAKILKETWIISNISPKSLGKVATIIFSRTIIFFANHELVNMAY